MNFSSPCISIEKNGPVGTLWLDRPEKHNAMSPEIWRDIPLALDALCSDGEVRAIVLAAKGKNFTVGLDLIAFGDIGGADSESQALANLRQIELTTDMQKSVSAFASCPLPVIAAVHGLCLGAGIDVITACDVRLATSDASFSIRETRIGIVADVGTLQRLPAIIGAGHVAELAYTGKDISAERAEKIGLLNDVYDSFESTYAAAQSMAEEIAANPPLAVRGTKYMLQQGENLTTEQSLTLNSMYTMISTLQSNDMREAMMAFMEKRAPTFTGS